MDKFILSWEERRLIREALDYFSDLCYYEHYFDKRFKIDKLMEKFNV